MNTQRRQQIKLFVIVYFVTVAVVSAISTPIHQAYETQRISVLKEREIGYINNAEQLIRSELSKALSDMGLIGSMPYIQASLREDSPESLLNVGKLFARFAEGYGIYDQIRVLSLQGQEVVRVNYDAKEGIADIVGEQGLQDKSDPYFLQTVASLKPGKVFISEISPNLENGVVEKPYQPVLRLGTLLSDPTSGQVTGVLAFTLRIQFLLDDFNRLMAGNNLHQGFLVDKNGNWLARPESEYSSFFSEQAEPFRDVFPQLWQEIQRLQAGVFNSHQGLYIYRSVAAENLIDFTVKPKNLPPVFQFSDHLNDLARLSIVIFLPNESLYATSFIHQQTAKWYFGFGALAHALVVWLIVSLYLRNHSQKISEQRNTKELARLYDLAPCGYLSVKDASIVNINDTLAMWLGYTKEEVIGKLDIHDLITSDSADNLTRRREELEKQHFILDDTEDFVRKDGSLLPVSLSASVDPDREGSWDIVRISVVDITDRRVKEQLLEARANTDDLSGLYNRRQFFHLAEMELSRSRRHHHSVSVMLLDVDKFKQVNDSYGHNAGDLVLITLANQITEALRTEDILARYGGEEFIIMLPATGLALASEVAERIREKVETTVVPIDNGREISITVSLGISQWDDSDESIDDLIRRADDALYQAKASGRNRVCYQLKQVGEFKA